MLKEDSLSFHSDQERSSCQTFVKKNKFQWHFMATRMWKKVIVEVELQSSE